MYRDSAAEREMLNELLGKAEVEKAFEIIDNSERYNTEIMKTYVSCIQDLKNKDYNPALKKINDVRANLDDALSDFVDDIQLLKQRATIYMYLGRLEDGLNDLNIVLEKYEDSDNLCLTAKIKHHMGNLDEAMKDLERAKELNELNHTVYFTTGLILFQEAIIQKSIPLLEDCVGNFEKGLIYHKDHSVYFHKAKATIILALMNKDQNLYQTILEDLSSAIELNPTSEYYTYRGNFIIQNKKDPTAIKDFDKAIELDPFNISNYLHRGQAKMVISDYKGAYKDFLLVAQFDPNYKDIKIHLKNATKLIQ